MDKLLMYSNLEIKNTLLNWRRGKMYKDYMITETGRHFNNKSFNQTLYGNIISKIQPFYIHSYDSFMHTNNLDNYTIIDHLINLEEYGMAFSIILEIKSLLHFSKN